MAEPGKHAQNEEEAHREADEHQSHVPEHGRPDHAGDAVLHTGVNRAVAPRIMHRHKGDVGRPETNEEIFQGFKTRELK